MQKNKKKTDPIKSKNKGNVDLLIDRRLNIPSKKKLKEEFPLSRVTD